MMGPGGLFVRIVHDGGVRSGYFHLNSFRVEAGQTVRAGEIIGTVGRTGVKASGSHLHFEVHRDGELKDPARFLSALRAAARGHRHLRDREGREEAAAGARRAGTPAGAGGGAEPFELEPVGSRVALVAPRVGPSIGRRA